MLPFSMNGLRQMDWEDGAAARCADAIQEDITDCWWQQPTLRLKGYALFQNLMKQLFQAATGMNWVQTIMDQPYIPKDTNIFLLLAKSSSLNLFMKQEE